MCVRRSDIPTTRTAYRIVRIGTSPKRMILAATSAGKRVPRGMGRLIHRSAWKGYSPNVRCSILHNSPRSRLKTTHRPSPAPVANHFISRRRIKMHRDGWNASSLKAAEAGRGPLKPAARCVDGCFRGILMMGFATTHQSIGTVRSKQNVLRTGQWGE